ncbi:MAG TPA: ester cyclase [Dehalococcoidia bacterium]|nr:ester cyclase [Dehalococcoidia bacterium]
MSLEENRNLVRRIYELWNQIEFSAYKELVSPDCVFHRATGDFSREQVIQNAPNFVAAFQDASCTIDDIIAQEDLVAFRENMKGTHRGEFQGFAPTGKQFNISNASIWKIVDGKLAESWYVFDVSSAMQQLGIVPS